MLASWLHDELDGVGEIKAFATADELADTMQRVAAAHPGVARLRRVGTSALGEPLMCLTIDDGSAPPEADALIIGLPHPNEPVGGLTALHLARRLTEDAALRARLGMRWHIVACIDPDGLRLNEGWLKGPFTREHYARHFYRQAGHEQIEWTFPLDYKTAYFDAVLPETLALMRLVDEVAPTLMCSLHNSELGGVYYYLGRSEPSLHPVLQAIPRHVGLTLDRGEPEAPWIPRLADGIFQTIDIRQAYDHLEATGTVRELTGGNSTASYTARYGTLDLVCELPYWTDERAGDTTVTPTSYADALAEQAAGMADLATVLTDALTAVAGATSIESPFLRASRFYTQVIRDMADDTELRCRDEATARPATVAELTSLADSVHMFRLRYAGMLLRALDGELAVGNVRPAIRATHRTLAERYERWCAEADTVTPPVPIPIGSLVTTQYGAVVAAAAHLADQRRTGRASPRAGAHGCPSKPAGPPRGNGFRSVTGAPAAR